MLRKPFSGLQLNLFRQKEKNKITNFTYIEVTAHLETLVCKVYHQIGTL